jgi:hypothetical protein
VWERSQPESGTGCSDHNNRRPPTYSTHPNLSSSHHAPASFLIHLHTPRFPRFKKKLLSSIYLEMASTRGAAGISKPRTIAYPESTTATKPRAKKTGVKKASTTKANTSKPRAKKTATGRVTKPTTTKKTTTTTTKKPVTKRKTTVGDKVEGLKLKAEGAVTGKEGKKVRNFSTLQELCDFELRLLGALL